jgi:putative membrane protein
MSISDLPVVNAILNSTSGVLILTGYVLIRQKRVTAHRACMVAAFFTSTIFLISYLTYHYFHGSTRFTGGGTIRIIYLSILLSHTVLAVIIVPLVLAALYRAVRGQFFSHARVARWAFPLWLYVSVTGVVVYLMLYQLYPKQGPH